MDRRRRSLETLNSQATPEAAYLLVGLHMALRFGATCRIRETPWPSGLVVGRGGPHQLPPNLGKGQASARKRAEAPPQTKKRKTKENNTRQFAVRDRFVRPYLALTAMPYNASVFKSKLDGSSNETAALVHRAVNLLPSHHFTSRWKVTSGPNSIKRRH